MSAIALLKSLANPSNLDAPIAVQVTDPALVNAKRDKTKVVLSFDPGFAKKAAETAILHHKLEKAQADFTLLQAEMRDYGRNKRDKFNDLFKTNVTTACVPYEVETPDGTKETRYVQVICSHKFSVQSDMILGARESLGEWMDRLFVVKTEKRLRPNAEDVIRNVLVEAGLTSEQADSAMASLFETVQKVEVREGYESDVKKVPPSVADILTQAVTRAAPGLKFPTLYATSPFGKSIRDTNMTKKTASKKTASKKITPEAEIGIEEFHKVVTAFMLWLLDSTLDDSYSKMLWFFYGEATKKDEESLKTFKSGIEALKKMSVDERVEIFFRPDTHTSNLEASMAVLLNKSLVAAEFMNDRRLKEEAVMTAKKKALAKLSAEERKILGFSSV